jgi:hypothetical protein
MKSAAVVALLSAMAVATTVVPMSIERLTEASTDVVLARAEDSWTEWNPAHTLLHTITRFRVARSLKGQATSTMLVRQLGGRAEGIEQKVAGVRSWRAGEEAVLFLRPSKEQSSAYAVTGLIQGNFRVLREGSQTFVSNGVAGVETARKNGRARFTGERMRLSELESRVRAAAQRSDREVR